MAKIYLVQREETMSDGSKYWNTMRTSKSKERAVAIAKEISGRTRVTEEEEEDY